MKTKVSLFSGLAIAAFASLVSCQQYNRVDIDLSQKGADVDKSMYGLFFEEINHAGDGGLYAELIQNRGFEEHVVPGGMTYRDGKAYAPRSANYYGLDTVEAWVPWDIEAKKMQGWQIKSSDVTYDVVIPQHPLHENTSHALSLTINKIASGETPSLINTGYWGMSVKKGEKYNLRFYLLSSDYSGDVTASIFDSESGRKVSEVAFDVNSDGKWNEYTATMIPEDDLEHANFSLSFNNKGTLLVDYVSLFPHNTFKNRPNGLRPDIAQMLGELHPAFLRWPGGCIVEGITLGNRVNWKETLGDPMTRPGQFSLWGYRNTYGFGYHEFLQFCEDLGMDAMFVANAGLSCSIRNGDYVSGEKALQPFLQDIEDAIEYATGDTTTTWGAKRAANGHPEPFVLKYVEIGNENGTDRYVDNYNYLYAKLKEKYPEITFINTLAWWFDEINRVEHLEMIDPHWYETPDYFYKSNTLFDSVPRGKYDIYVGEYACNNGVGSGNMNATLSEAAFMMGMERNSDVVKMTSYAPLLTNVNAPNWHCNLIWFDRSRVAGRASYYLQKMFADNRPDYNVSISPTVGTPVKQLVEPGTFGVGSWNTQVEYKDFTVSSGDKTTSISMDKVVEFMGEWQKNDGTLAQTSAQSPTMAVFGDFNESDYTVRFKARKTSGKEGFVFYFGLTSEGKKGYAFNVGGWNNTSTNLQSVVDRNLSGADSKAVPFTVESGKWYDVEIKVSPDMTSLKMDGKEVISWGGQEMPQQFFLAGYDKNAGEAVIKAVNASSSSYPAEFNLAGASEVSRSGTITTLKSESLDDENSLDEPFKIAPETKSFDGFSSQFKYDLPPYSVVVMRVKVKLD